MEIFFNWRRDLFIVMQVLIVIGSFSPQTEQICAGWWMEQQRSDRSWRTVRCPVAVPAWYTRFQALTEGLKTLICESDVLMRAAFCLLNITGLMWFLLFRRVILLMIKKGIDPLQFDGDWSSPLPEVSGILKIHVAAVVTPDSGEVTVSGMRTVRQSVRPDKVRPEIRMADTEPALLPAVFASGEETDMKGYAAVIQEKSAEPAVSSIRKPPVKPYAPSVENEMRKFYNTLSEKDKRRYAGVEALKMGHGGIVYIGGILGCGRKTVSKGIRELKRLPPDTGYEKRIRKPGGGRKCYEKIHPDINEKFSDVLMNYTAGDPMRGDVLWTNLTHRKIAEKLAEKHGIRISTTVIRQLLVNNKYRKRKPLKKITMKEVANRNAQFENIAELKKECEASGNPCVSIDTKKREQIGNFQREGHLYSTGEIHTNDHDFRSYAKGVVITHGIYDGKYNTGYINLGTSRDTSEFACDCLRNWWYNQGKYDYPHATYILILCDGGGSNSSRSYIFKEDIQKLADEIGIEIRIAHYPPYTSKYNPIEHRFFPHVTRACRGVIFEDINIVRELMEKTETTTGLRATVNIIDREYKTGRKASEDFRENIPIIFDDYLPQWNYRAVPNGQVI